MIPRIFVIGALGRCGRGAVEMAHKLGVPKYANTNHTHDCWGDMQVKIGGDAKGTFNFVAPNLQNFLVLFFDGGDKILLCIVV